jgi:hypothetical protein
MRDRFANLTSPVRLALFATLLAVVGAVAVGVGAATRDDSGAPRAGGDGMAMSEPMTRASHDQASGLVHTAPFTVKVER